MNSPASVEGDDRLRLFCALTLPASVRDAVGEWQERLPSGDFRLVPHDSLHLTLAFLGSRPAGELGPIGDALGEAAHAARPIVLRPSRYRETRSVGMVVFDDEDGNAGAVAADLHGRLERLGVYEPERRPWLPHLTVIRFRSKPRLRVAPPELGAVSPSEAAVYHSVLRPTGAQYVVLRAAPLGEIREVGG